MFYNDDEGAFKAVLWLVAALVMFSFIARVAFGGC